MDSRIRQLASVLTHYASGVKSGSKVLVECHGCSAVPLLRELVREIQKAGGCPYVTLEDVSVTRLLLSGATPESLDFANRHRLALMQDADVFIGINATDNIFELQGVAKDKSELAARKGMAVAAERINRTKWVVLRFPNQAMAQSLEMDLESFEDFYYAVCLLDYARLSRAMDPLVDLMNRTDQVRITGPDTDISFSIRGIAALKDDGKYNLPGGEVMTAPVRDSVNGVITYNVPAVLRGRTYEDVRLTFENGRIVSAQARGRGDISSHFDLDEGARYTGEFAIGVHPLINRPMKDVLFDEKIAGSFHLTPGNPYLLADNGNRSALHWDLISLQTREHGGGEIRFDGALVRRDGLFIPDELKPLNPGDFLG